MLSSKAVALISTQLHPSWLCPKEDPARQLTAARNRAPIGRASATPATQAMLLCPHRTISAPQCRQHVTRIGDEHRHPRAPCHQGSLYTSQVSPSHVPRASKPQRQSNKGGPMPVQCPTSRATPRVSMISSVLVECSYVLR
jgi:hypothetical protein